jgi:glucose/arabinose dehydrogenase
MKHTAALVALALFAGSSAAFGQSVIPSGEGGGKVPLKITDPKVYTAADGTKYSVQTVASKLEVPWAMAFDPDGRCFLTERKGRVRIIGADGKLIEKPALTLSVTSGGEIGLMGLCLHPDFAKNHFVYLSYGDKAAKDIRVTRFIEKDGTLTKDKDILTGIETGGNHAGCGIKFAPPPDGKLYISTGEHFSRELAQKMDVLNGKILRVNDDGTIPSDNPWAGANKKAGTREEIWTLGNRNPQGFDWHPVSGLMYETEHGPSGEPVNNGKGASASDEFNLIEKGKNYGWPVIYADAKHEGMVSPLKQWTPAIAPSGGAFVRSDKQFAGWVGNYMVGGLGGLQAKPIPGVYMVKLSSDGKSVDTIDRLVPDMGRIRAVAQAPDGSIWFSTSNKDGRARDMGDKELDDQICRITAVK